MGRIETNLLSSCPSPNPKNGIGKKILYGIKSKSG
jgi:hypothetical protein